MLPRCAFLFHLVHTWLLSLAQECDFPETPTNTLSLFPLQGGTWGLPDSASRPPRVCWTVVPPLEWAHLLRGWFSCISSGRYPFLPHPKAEMSCLLKLVQRQEERATVKITSEQNLSDSPFFSSSSSFAKILLAFSFYVCGYRCREEGSWECWASLVAWKMMWLLRSNTLQSLESGQAHQHLVPMPGLLGEQSAHSDGETGQLQGHRVWCGAQAAFLEYRWGSPLSGEVPRPGEVPRSQVRSPHPGEPHTCGKCVQCAVSSPSEWTSKKMVLWFLVFISYIWPVLSPPNFTHLLLYEGNVSYFFITCFLGFFWF